MEVRLKILAIVQARLGSIRMPNKVMAPLGKASVATFLYERLRKSAYLDNIIYAIPDNVENNILCNYLVANKINVFRGSERDVLKDIVIAPGPMNLI